MSDTAFFIGRRGAPSVIPECSHAVAFLQDALKLTESESESRGFEETRVSVVELANCFGARLALYDPAAVGEILESLSAIRKNANQLTCSLRKRVMAEAAIFALDVVSRRFQERIASGSLVRSDPTAVARAVPELQLLTSCGETNADEQRRRCGISSLHELVSRVGTLVGDVVFEQNHDGEATIRATLDIPESRCATTDFARLPAISLQTVLAAAFYELKRLRRPDVIREALSSGRSRVSELLNKRIPTADRREALQAVSQLQSQPLDDAELFFLLWRHGMVEPTTQSVRRRGNQFRQMVNTPLCQTVGIDGVQLLRQASEGRFEATRWQRTLQVVRQKFREVFHRQ